MNANNVRMNNKLFIFKEYRSPGGISTVKRSARSSNDLYDLQKAMIL